MIPFNRPFIIGKELYYVAQAVQSGHLSGDGPFTRKCHAWLETRYGASKALLTHSCTAALEMAAILAEIQPGDEFILPSYTFVSTANAFVLRGGIPVWCDKRPDTLNLDENRLEALITPKTKAIIPVHYAGVGCEMETIMAIAERHNLLVIEDAAQAVNATYKGRYLGTLGHLGCISFHETKNLISGEGGALLVNDDRFLDRAEIIREKGTDRCDFFRGKANQYTWIDCGSSFLPSELVAAFLYAQFEEADTINAKRLRTWNAYYQGLKPLQDAGKLQLGIVPPECEHNAHMFYILLPSAEQRDGLMDGLRDSGISSVFHYVPLHSSPMGRSVQPRPHELPVTDCIAPRLLRLPMFHELSLDDVSRICESVIRLLSG